MPRRLAALTAAALVATPAAAQAPSAAELAAIKTSGEARAQGRCLAAIKALEPVAFDSAGKPIANMAFQYWSQFSVPVTAERPRVTPYPQRPLTPEQAAELNGVTTGDALAEITRRARATRIVFLNESHSDPQQRAFGLAVARALRPLGYRTLAIETLANDADESKASAAAASLQHDGYVRRGTGTYTQDPVFADFVRQALALGYRPVAYEQTGNSREVAPREAEQARYLIARALPTGDDDKLLVYVGLSHATEAPNPSSGAAPSAGWRRG